MRFQLFCMFDQMAGVFLQPFCARSAVDARRQLTLGFENRDFLETPAGRYPHEFAMYHVGEFDDESGVIDSVKPVRVCLLSDCRPLPTSSTVSS